MSQAAPSHEVPAVPSPILLLTNQLDPGGAERYVVTVSGWLAEQGARVVVAAAPGDFAKDLHPSVLYHPVPLRDLRWSLPLAAARVRRLVARHRPRIIVANTLVTAWVATLAQAGFDLPVVAIGHGWPEDRFSRVAPLLRVADRVVPVSPLVERRLVANGLPADKCRVIYNGVDLSPFDDRSADRRAAARARIGLGPRDIVVINVGRLAAQKAQHHIVDLAARTRSALPDLRLVIVGGGEREAELARLVAERGVEDRVLLVGSRHDVPDLLVASDVFLNCSNWEGMPLSTIEGMAAGLPVVATATEGAPELVVDEMGEIVPVGDVDAMQAAIARLASDPALRREMGEAARRRARTHFGHDRMCGDLAALLAELVDG